MKYKQVVLCSTVLLAGTALADSLSGEDRFLCSAVEATVCTDDGVCESGAAWDWQIPQFLVIDLDRKLLSTTQASGEDRVTPILSLTRQDGQIVLQGVQTGRAFSMVLNEVDGRTTIAIATDGATINVFGACTPVPVD